MKSLTFVIIAALVTNICCFDMDYGQKLYSGDALESRYGRSPQNTQLGDFLLSPDLELSNGGRYRRSPQASNPGIPQAGGNGRRRRNAYGVPFRGNIGKRFRQREKLPGYRIQGR